jgi:hypothetical protein
MCCVHPLRVYSGIHKHDTRKGKTMTRIVITDGGRAKAGYKGTANDCAVRAIAIAWPLPYKVIYDDMSDFLEAHGEPRSARNGIEDELLKKYLGGRGWKWFDTSNQQVHLNADELPAGKIIVAIKSHVLAMIDGVMHDNYDWSKDGNEIVEGYWVKA